ncbi:MAG: sugar MFS transporter [Armatimonadota bacterium]
MGAEAAGGSTTGVAGFHDRRLFVASCVALISTAVIFAVRGDILGDLSKDFALTPPQLGWIMALAFWGFTVAILIGGNLCDLIGMKAIIGLAFAFHFAGTLLTIYAPGWIMLAVATLVIGLGNGFVEGGINPLVATIYPDQKTHKLNLLHAWWPGGIVLGSVASYGLTQIGQGWQMKMWLIMIPTVIYGVLFLSLKLPETERVQSGISAKDMYKEAFRPLFLVFLFSMLLTAAVELGTNQWIGEIMKKSGISSGILVLAWISLIMLVGRMFAGPVVHKLAPTGVLLLSSATAIIGLLWLSTVRTPAMAYAASFVFALGICYYWPTMLGVTSERFPKGGALLLGLMGATGMASAGFSQPLMGKLYQTYGPEGALRYLVVLPIALVVIFGLVWLTDRARGGYKVQKLG